MGKSIQDKHVPFLQFILIGSESGTSLTILLQDLELIEKSKWNTIFHLDIMVGNFCLPLKMFCFKCFGKFQVRKPK